MTGRLPDVGGLRVRVTRREERGPAVAHGAFEVTPVARSLGVGLAGRGASAGIGLSLPGQVEVRRDGVLWRRRGVPDWGLRIWIGSVAVIGLAMGVRAMVRRRG